MTIRIKQSKNSASCISCVACMATNTTVKEFKEFIKPRIRGPFPDLYLYSYLLSKGYTVGIGIDFRDGATFFNKNTTIKFKLQLYESPAYLVVKSHRVDKVLHAVYWDGEHIFDPNPYMPNNPDLSLYTILHWYPITKIDYPKGFHYIKPKKHHIKKRIKERGICQDKKK